MKLWLLASAVLAGGDPPADPVPPSEPAEEEIVVTGVFARDPRDSASPVLVVIGSELERDLRPQIGDALARQPGVSASSFGPNASRPILRGLAGERVRVLTDGIGAFDVSNTSADHAVAIDPLLADRIEVLRGPASLRYGSSAIGGVVNVLDRRIPMEVPDTPVAGQLRLGLGSVAKERAAKRSAGPGRSPGCGAPERAQKGATPIPRLPGIGHEQRRRASAARIRRQRPSSERPGRISGPGCSAVPGAGSQGRSKHRQTHSCRHCRRGRVRAQTRAPAAAAPPKSKASVQRGTTGLPEPCGCLQPQCAGARSAPDPASPERCRTFRS
jgi:hypothetical protein